MKDEYSIIQAPLYPKHSDIIEMEPEELKRLCNEKRIMFFTLRVNNIINTFGYPENPKKPYLKHIVFLPGIWLIAKEPIEETPQEAQP